MPVTYIDNFDSVRATVKSKLGRDVVYATAEAIKKSAIDKVPVSDESSPGYVHLYQTIRVVGINQYAAEVVAGDPRQGVLHAPYVEYGTYKMAARPYLTPAAVEGERFMANSLRNIT